MPVRPREINLGTTVPPNSNSHQFVLFEHKCPFWINFIMLKPKKNLSKPRLTILFINIYF